IMILSAVLIACFSLFMCSFTNDNNVVKQIATGKPHDPTKPQNDKSDPKQSPATTKTDSSQTQNENADPDSPFNNESDLDVRTAYNPSDPFGYEPVQYVEPTSVRVFSGC